MAEPPPYRGHEIGADRELIEEAVDAHRVSGGGLLEGVVDEVEEGVPAPKPDCWKLPVRSSVRSRSLPVKLVSKSIRRS